MHSRWPAILVLAALAFAGCNRNARLPQYELSGATMGTTFNVKLVAPPESLSREVLGKEIAATLDSLEQLTSTYIDDSELSHFNASRSTDWVNVSADLCTVTEQALEISRSTSGAFDITVGPLVNLWGFGPEGTATEPPAQQQIDDALTRVGYERLQTRCTVPAMRKEPHDVYLDLSGWAKGYAVDQLAELLNRHSLSDYLVEIGGELRVRGHNAEGLGWAVAIEKPLYGERSPQKILRLTDVGVATSGDYRNYFEYKGERYSHTIDARNGRPVSHALAAVTVIAESTAFADAMATALLVMGPISGPDMAEKLGIAGIFLVRGQAGFEELTTTLFDRMGLR